MDESLKSLPELPKSTDKFWDGAVKYQTEIRKRPPCEHYFEYKGALEITCKNCSIGYFLSGKEYLKDGRIGIRK